jgi:hypothetical protein
VHGGSGWLPPQVSTLAQGACLPPIGQAAPLPQTLASMRHAMEEKTPETLLGLQRQGVHLMAWAPRAIPAAHTAIAHPQEAMLGHRAAVDRASQGREPLGCPDARALGVDHPCLARELIEPGGEARGGAAPGRRLRTAPGLFGGCLW